MIEFKSLGKSTGSNSSWKLTYNAPLTLSFTLIAFVFLIMNYITGGLVNAACALTPDLSFIGLYRYLTYVLCHANWAHLASNSLYLLMLGPLLEEKYGAKELLVMSLITAVITGLINTFLFRQVIVGASGIVFMFIILSSLVNMKRKEIPLTFILVTFVFIGNEIINSLGNDNISQFGHICGGLCGGALGFLKRNVT